MLWLYFLGSAGHTRPWPSLNCLLSKITIQENNIWSDSLETLAFLPTPGIRPSNVDAMSLICNSPSYHIVRKVNVNKTVCKNITSDSVKAIQQITKQSQTVCRLIESFSYVRSPFMTVETVILNSKWLLKHLFKVYFFHKSGQTECFSLLEFTPTIAIFNSEIKRFTYKCQQYQVLTFIRCIECIEVI